MDEITLNRIKYTFIQEGNTLGTTSKNEYMIITVENPIGDIKKDGGFFVIETDGWSINDHEELKDLLEIVENGVKLKKYE